MLKKITSTVAGAFVFIIAVNILSRGLVFVREILFAANFGLGPDFDIYLVAAVFPITINTIILYLGQNFFIPTYNRIKATDENSAASYFKFMLTVFVAAGLVIAAALYFFAEPVLSNYISTTDAQVLSKAVNIFSLFLITIPLNSAISIIIAYQHSEYEFKYPAISRLFLNFLIIPVLILFAGEIGIYTIPIGFVLGTLTQLLFLIFKGKIKLSFDIINVSNLKANFKYLDLSILSILLIETIGQVYMISDRYFFGQVQQGGISALSYAINLFQQPISIVALALSTVIFPKFSENIQKGDYKNFQKNLNDVVNVNLLIFVPVAFILFFYGDVIIQLLFERGKFGSADTNMTFLVLKAYVISIIFYSSYAVANKIIYGAQLVNTLLIITIVGILLKIGLNFLLVETYQQNGLALASSVSYIFFFVAAFIVVQIKLPVDIIKVFSKGFLFYAVNGLIALVLADILITGFDNLLLQGILKILFFLFVFLMNIKITNHNSLQLLNDLLKLIKTSKAK